MKQKIWPLKPHICFVSESPILCGLLTGWDQRMVGGAEIQQVLIALALRRMGYEITFLIPDTGQPDEIITVEGIRLIKTYPVTGERGIFHRLQNIRRLLKALSRAGAHIYWHQSRPVATGLIALFCLIKGRPFVYTVASDKWANGEWRKSVPRVCIPLSEYALRYATVIVQTGKQQDMLRVYTGNEGVLIRPTFSPPDAEENGDRKHVLWVANFGKVKRPEMFLELAKRLPEYRFVMVGGPYLREEDLFESVKALAASVANLEMTGPVPYDHVGKYFSEAAVFVNTSSSEGFPNTYLQAWRRRVPVVATFDVDGLLSSGELGRYCSDLNELEAGVRELMEDRALRESLGDNALKYVEENHSPDSVASAHDRLFMKLYKR